jgi:hypothetical protein
MENDDKVRLNGMPLWACGMHVPRDLFDIDVNCTEK